MYVVVSIDYVKPDRLTDNQEENTSQDGRTKREKRRGKSEVYKERKNNKRCTKGRTSMTK